jgi:hypothetical protein
MAKFKLNDKVQLINTSHQSHIQNDIWKDPREVGTIGIITLVYDKSDGATGWVAITPNDGSAVFVANENELQLLSPHPLYKKRDWIIIKNLLPDADFVRKLSNTGRIIGNIGWIDSIGTEKDWYLVVMTEHSATIEFVHSSEIELYTPTEELEAWDEPNITPIPITLPEDNDLIQWLGDADV